MENKLRKKFDKINKTSLLKYTFIDRCEQLANDHTEQFGEFLIKNCNHQRLEYLNIKQLVEIFNRDYYGL